MSVVKVEVHGEETLLWPIMAVDDDKALTVALHLYAWMWS